MSVAGPTTTQQYGIGSSFSNGGQQTRGLSAGDWTRLQKLRQSRNYTLQPGSDIITVPMNQLPYSPPLLTSKVVGTSRIRRSASNYTDYIASQKADFVTSSKNANNSTTLSVTKLCSCTTTTLNTKVGNCQICRFKNLSAIPAQTVPYSGPNGVRNMLRTWL